MARRRKSEDGVCSICGAFGLLTYEHIPPEAAFNDSRILEADIDALFAARSIAEMEAVPKRQNQRGAGNYTLCSRCNSNTGAWYVPAYIEWARQGWWNIHSNPGYIYNRPFEIEPLRVVKQVLAMFASACGPSFFEHEHALRRFVLNRDQTGLPRDVRLYAYYVHPDSRASRQSGITANMDITNPSGASVYAEIAFPPFGYVLCLNSPPPDRRLVDISDMARSSLDERRTLSLHLPGLEVNSVLPADFRSDAAIKRQMDQNT